MIIRLFAVGVFKGEEIDIFINHIVPKLPQFDTWEVHGFEPYRPHYDKLIEKYKDYPNVKMYNLAISDKEELAVPLYHANSPYGHSLYKGKYNVSEDTYSEVETIRLSEFIRAGGIQKKNSFNILNFNIEGAEINLFRDLDKSKQFRFFDLFCGDAHDLVKCTETKDTVPEFNAICARNQIDTKPFNFKDVNFTFKRITDILTKSTKRLSVIVPYVNEYPQNIFTVAALHEDLRGIDHEIIVINNTGQCKSEEYFNEVTRGHKWLKSLSYSEKLSHWQAKNSGIAASTGDVLFFCDAHCIPGKDAVSGMYQYYRDNMDTLNGSIHLPLTYSILEWRKLMYRLVSEPEKGIMHYSFKTFMNSDQPYEVPCMSSCGMMISKDILMKMGGFPTELGIYGGGENFLNFTMAVLGHKKWLYPEGVLRHHAEKRGYSWNYTDYHRNRIIANYCFGGEDWAYRYADAMSAKVKDAGLIAQEVINKVNGHRELIESQQVLSIEDWVKGELHV